MIACLHLLHSYQVTCTFDASQHIEDTLSRMSVVSSAVMKIGISDDWSKLLRTVKCDSDNLGT